ncbi:MAG: CoB--CoM heterodisulfide reductase iron-sulfur subunit A family protein [bacterium]
MSRRKDKSASHGENPRIGVFVCNCGVNIAGFIDTKAVAEYALGLPDVVFVRENLYSCSEAGVRDIKQAIVENRLERVVVAACTPRTHEPTFQAACEEAGLNRYYFEFVNIREQCSWVHKESRDEATRKAKDLIRMGVARARHLKPLKEITGDVVKRALVIGGGVSGMTAALELANRGFEVILVEKKASLGGLAEDLYRIQPIGTSANQLVKQLLQKLGKSPLIKVHISTEVEVVKGFIGNYDVKLTSIKEPLKVGVIIVATGAVPLIPSGIHGYDGKRVISMFELEGMLRRGRKLGKRIIIICCAGVRTSQRLYCSRICCLAAIKNALILRSKHKSEVTILYRDLMCYGIENENLLREAKRAGVRFINFSDDSLPVVEKQRVKVRASLLGKEFALPYDRVVLTTALLAPPSNQDLSRMLKVPLDQYGFFLEAHIKLRPLDFSTDGIFVCGTARWPASVEESIIQATGASARASTILAAGKVRVEPIVSHVDEENCRGCGLCVSVCPYGAIEIIETERGMKARSIEVACKGCGTCGATCYRKAITMNHFSNEQIFAQVTAAFAEE